MRDRRTRIGIRCHGAIAAVVVGAAAAVVVPPSTIPEAAAFEVTAPVWIDDTRAYEFRYRIPGDMGLVVIDRSGHAVDVAEYPQRIPPPVLAERVTAVRILFDPPVAGSVPTDPRPALVSGFYRNGDGSLLGCRQRRPGVVTICIGFSQAVAGVMLDPERSDDVLADIPNMVREVSAVLDVVTARPEWFPPIDLDHVVYAGYSIGAMVGYAMAHPSLRDPRIGAVAALSGFAPDWVPALMDPTTWASAPDYLMINGHRDEIVPYESARRTYRVARRAGRTELISVRGSDHGLRRCTAAWDYRRAWIDARLGLSVDLLTAWAQLDLSRCARHGGRRGGTVGDGRFALLRP